MENAYEIIQKLRYMAENSRSKHDVLTKTIGLIESLQSQLASSQRREQAAVADVEFLMRNSGERGVCKLCTHKCIITSRVKPKCCDAKWRGSQEAGKGETE